MKFAVTALLVLALTGTTLAQTAPQYAHATVKAPGCTFVLPPYVVVNVSPTEDTSHGFGLDLVRPGDEHEWDGTPMRYIGFNTRWDVGDLPSLQSVIDSMTRDLNQLIPQEVQGPGVIRVVSTLPAKLGDLPARRMILEFTNAEKKPAIKQIVVAYRTRPDAAAMIYMASLTTTRLNFQQDVTLFAKILSGFKLTPE